jgi:glycosyltransferase involved in cell wall biosynthesis
MKPMNKRNKQVLIVSSQTGYEQIYKIPFELLNNWGYSFRTVQEYELTVGDLAGANYLILYRCTTGPALSLVRLAKAKKIPVIYELDDDLLALPDEEWGKRCIGRGLSWIVSLFLREACIIKAGSAELAERLNNRGYFTIYQPYPVKFIQRKEGAPPDSPYKIGYFGTRHHQSDILAIFPALEAVQIILNDQVSFEFIGCCPQDVSGLKNVEVFQPVVGYERFLEFLAERNWALGLVPLRQTHFNEAKSDSKFRDLSAAGIIGIYSDVLPYRESVIDGLNGWLCGEAPKDWIEIIVTGLKSADRLSMVSCARQQLLHGNNPEKIAQNWDSLFNLLKQ